MRRFIFTIAFFIISINCVYAQVQTSKEQAKVNQAIIDLFDKLSTLDTTGMKQYTTSDFLLLENGEVWNMDTLANKISQMKSVTMTRINHLDFIRTEVNNNTAWVAYHNEADISMNGQKIKLKWLESAFLVKDKKEWEIVMLHSTKL